ncbi:MAG: aminotransferase class V-fold PLP-dependent enzyme [Patescibacteria group bacterium]|nr:aminotransferase class V-fold PLP-dependent enzyme [Patescibacteria group bacterium]
MAIPRTKIGFKYRDIIKFLFELVLPAAGAQGEKIIQEFEEKYAANFGLPRAVAFSKARMGLYFLLKNLNLKPGGEVIISAIHVADFVNIIYSAGFKPVVVDVSAETYGIDYDDLEKKINHNTVLMFITHLSGLATDMDKIIKISRARGVPFVEDCSQAVSSYYQDRKLGTFGVAAIFSLSLLKPVCTFFGGVVISADKGLLERIRQEKEKIVSVAKLPLAAEAIKHLIIKLATEKIIFALFVFPLLRLFSAPFDFFSQYQRHNKKVVFREELPKGYFVKFIWPQALLGLGQLATLGMRERKKIDNAELLYSRLSNERRVKKAKLLGEGKNSFWTFPLYVEDIADFKKYLAKHGIDSTAYLLSVLGDEPSLARFNFTNPQASRIKKHTLLMPMYAQLTGQEVEHMAAAINKY